MSRFSSFALAGALLFAAAPLWAQTPGAAAPLTSSVSGPSGLRREVGSWLFNDSIFVFAGANQVAPGASPFVPGLRRDKKPKLPFFAATPTRAPLHWATLSLPSLQEMLAPGFNFAGLPVQLAAQVAAAKTSGALYVGWSLPVGTPQRAILNPLPTTSSVTPNPAPPAPTRESVAPVLQKLRAALDAVAPDSALVLNVYAPDDVTRAVAQISAAAPSCDAVLLNVDASNLDDLWPLKMARRVVEEQKDFDLPVIVAPLLPSASAIDPARDARLLEFFQGGATGFVLPEGATLPNWAGAAARNADLLSGAVTLEDAGVLPAPNAQTLRLVDDLRAAGRIPLAGRLPEDGKGGESLLAVLDDATTLDTLDKFDKAARGGATLYLEGVPDLKNKALLDKLAAMTGTSIEALPSPRSEVLSLRDAWLFGDARGREFPVVQRVKWAVKTTLAAQTQVKKGEASPLPQTSAALASDENGLLYGPLGRGAVLWLPHVPQFGPADAATRRVFYAAIAGSLQASLVSWKPTVAVEGAPTGVPIRAALRSSKTGTPLVALFNDGATDVALTLTARSDAPVALDLLSDHEFAATVRDYSSSVNVTVPAHGAVWLIFGKNRVTLDKERLAPRPKARTK